MVVVIAHVSDWNTRFMFFCMPLFFFISGYLFRPVDDFGPYLRNLTRKLVVPYFLFMAIIAAPNVFHLFATEGSQAGLNRIGHLLLGGEKITGVWAAFWYIPCFYFMHIVYSISARFLSSHQISLVCIPLWMFAIWNHINAEFWLPLSINVVAMAVPLMHAGRLYRNREFSLTFDKAFHIFAAIAGISYALSAGFQLVPSLQIKLAGYGWPIVTIVCAVLMVIVTKVCFDRFIRYPIVNLVFGELGKASLIIMFVHQPIQMSIVSLLDIHHEAFRIGAALTMSYGVFLILDGTRWGRILFLGKGAPTVSVRQKLLQLKDQAIGVFSPKPAT